jgi:hypothetical protein
MSDLLPVQMKSPKRYESALFLHLMLSRFCSPCFAALLLLSSLLSVSRVAFATEFGGANSAPRADDSDSSRDFEVGSRLVATTDVKLRDVSLSKGSRVTVRGIEVKRGRAASFDVELADGQVLKHIEADTIRRSFVASDD